MAMMTKEQLLAPDKLKVEKVEVGKTHGFIKQMNAHEHSLYSRMLTKEVPKLDDKGKATGQTEVVQDTTDWPSKIVACTLCDEQGSLLLEPGDWEVLANGKSGAFIDKLASVAVRLNNITPTDQEERVKN